MASDPISGSARGVPRRIVAALPKPEPGVEDEPDIDQAPDRKGVACGQDRGAFDVDRELRRVVAPEIGREERGQAEGRGATRTRRGLSVNGGVLRCLGQAASVRVDPDFGGMTKSGRGRLVPWVGRVRVRTGGSATIAGAGRADRRRRLRVGGRPAWSSTGRPPGAGRVTGTLGLE